MLTVLRRHAKQLESGREGEYPSQAAVLIALTSAPDPEIILTKRAGHLSSHSGEVSLPGGKWDQSDRSLLHTALRESHEEIGLEPSLVEILGGMSPRFTRWDVLVTPYVGIVPQSVELIPNLDELDNIFKVPLSYFLEADNRARTDLFDRRNKSYWAPAYMFKGYEIWGFTAGLLVDFLNGFFDAGIVAESTAPVRRWG